MYQAFDGTLYTEHFDGDDTLEVQLSRHRFVFAGVPSELPKWEAIQREYTYMKARRDAVTS